MQPDLPQTESAIVEMTNAFRKASALQELKPNAALTTAARAYAQYLATAARFAHDADGRPPQDRALAQGYRYCLVAENLAWQRDSRGFEARQLARQMVDGWKASTGHRANLLLPGMTEIGIGVARVPDKDPKFLAVQMLARPEALKIKFSIQNLSETPVRYAVGSEAGTLQPRATVTYASCNQRPLSLEATDGKSPARFEPHDRDRFVIRGGKGQAFKVDVERK
jgi:Cysteine-rich secretory protein family